MAIAPLGQTHLPAALPPTPLRVPASTRWRRSKPTREELPAVLFDRLDADVGLVTEAELAARRRR